MNPFDLLKNLNIEELKKKSQEAMQDLKNIIVTGEAGGGFVKIKMSGDFQIISIDYEENDIIKDDIKTFRDLIIAAHNDAISKLKEEIQKKFSNTMIPGLF
jgi:hypothetical protein